MAKSKFWSDPTITPKRAFKFLVSLGTGERQLPSFVCKKVTKPSFDITETPHKFLNHTFYFPGRLEWQTIDLTAVDPLTPDASKIIAEILKFSGYNVPTQATAGRKVTISKRRATATAIKTMEIHSQYLFLFDLHGN